MITRSPPSRRGLPLVVRRRGPPHPAMTSGLFRTFGEPGLEHPFTPSRPMPWHGRAHGVLSMVARPPMRLDGLHHALPQEPDARPSIALALEHLQAVDMALDGTIAPGQREPCFDRREILLQALGKTCKRLNPARGRLGHPRCEGVAPALPHERQKGL